MSLLKEPILHFGLLGVAIFAWFALANPDAAKETAPDEIVVDQQIIQTLGAQYRAKMNRDPLPEEARALMERYIQNEAMVREARNLGLDEGDGVVRNRLVQKMTFLATSAAQSALPDDATLEKHLRENPDRFTSGAKATFEQYGLASDIDAAAVYTILVQLQNGEQPAQPSAPQLLPERLENHTQQQIDGIFGRGFFANIKTLPIGKWSGPVQSGYGYHHVRLTDLVPAELPPLDAVRQEVLLDWRHKLAKQLTEAHIEGLMDRYEIARPSQDELMTWVAE